MRKPLNGISETTEPPRDCTQCSGFGLLVRMDQAGAGEIVCATCNGDGSIGILPESACPFHPGSLAKVAWLMARYNRGEWLWHPQDADHSEHETAGGYQDDDAADVDELDLLDYKPARKKRRMIKQDNRYAARRGGTPVGLREKSERRDGPRRSHKLILKSGKQL